MNMECLYINEINTTTMITVSTNTDSADNLFDRNYNLRYTSQGDNDDNTTTTIDIDFDITTSIDHIILQNINLKSFKIYYNDTTTNLISDLNNAKTTTSEWSQNSETSLYLYFSVTNMTSVHIAATATMIANSEKAIGQLWATRRYVQLERNPDYEQYEASMVRKEYSHEMSDGGITTVRLADKFQAEIELTYQSASMTSKFEDLRDEDSPFVFVPFPTGTGWEGKKIWEVNWIGDNEFESVSGNNWSSLGYRGTMNLVETPS